MADWTLFFPPGAPVLALPSWRSPRLYLSAQGVARRWENSSFYPASRSLARLYRLSLRIKATAGLAEVRQVRSSGWPLGEFTRDVLPPIGSAVALVGTPGPAQKTTVRLLSAQDKIVGYLKYAEKEAARRRLRQEHGVLRSLPEMVGPRVLKFGAFGDGEALLTTALVGEGMPASLPPTGDLVSFLASLNVSPPVPLEAHPWAKRTQEQRGFDLGPWFEALAGRDWPTTIQHGDFAPWNLLRRPDGNVGAIDWEYGLVEGFPHLDLAYYILQILALIQRRDPLMAAQYTTTYLARQPQLGLSTEEARSLTCFAAYDAYLKSREDGQPDDARLQAWRRAVWESQTRGS